MVTIVSDQLLLLALRKKIPAAGEACYKCSASLMQSQNVKKQNSVGISNILYPLLSRSIDSIIAKTSSIKPFSSLIRR